METIRTRWVTFANTIANRVCEFDETEGERLRTSLLDTIPTTEEDLEYGIAFTTFQHYGLELTWVLTKQGCDMEAAMVSGTLLALMNKFGKLHGNTNFTNEFTKEIKLARPL